MFATAHSKPHSQRKRLITNVYSKSFVQSSRSLHAISKEILFKRLLPMFQDLTSTSTPTSIPISAATPLKVDTSNTKDVLPLNYAIAMDFMNAYLFGISRSSNFIHDVSARNEFLRWYHCRKMYTFWAQELPNLTSWLRCLLGVKLVPDFVDEANKRIEQFCWEMCVKAHEGVGSEKEQVGEGNADEPTVYRQLANGLERTAEKGDANLESVSRDNMIASEMLDHLAAGHETSGIALTFTMYHLSRNTAIQDALRKELLTLQPPLLFPPANAPPSSSLPIEDTVLPTSQSVDALPLLQAILLETLRLNAPIPGPEPRVTPSTTGGVQLGEYKALPGGVRVSTPAYTLHRNEEVFPEPETWRPERWLEADEAQRREMGRWWWAFSSGGRMCIGSNFAMQDAVWNLAADLTCAYLLEMKVVLAAIYTNFQTELVSDEILEQSDGYTAGPKAEKLLLRFTRARDS
ncbi:hypothetical protein MMC25_006589 [Agyrium rufum]|nr:hypothetical protein [Agyrium rufum]